MRNNVKQTLLGSVSFSPCKTCYVLYVDSDTKDLLNGQTANQHRIKRNPHSYVRMLILNAVQVQQGDFPLKGKILILTADLLPKAQ